MKKTLLILLIITTIGCNKITDLKELTIIKTIGISYDNNYTIYAQLIDHIDKNNEPMMKVLKASGNSIEDSFNNLKKLINNEVYLSHLDLLVLSNNLNNDNYQSIINYFVNNEEFRNDFYCIFSNDIPNLLEKSKYDEIEIFLKTKEKQQGITIQNFNDVIKSFIDKDIIILPTINYEKELINKGNYQYHKKEILHEQKN